MITITIKSLLNCVNTLNILIKKPLNIYTAYKIARIGREVQHELDLFNAAKDTLLKQYGQTDENGNITVDDQNNYIIRKDCLKEFSEQYQKLMEQKIQLNVEALTLEELKEERFTPQDIINIIEFINK